MHLILILIQFFQLSLFSISINDRSGYERSLELGKRYDAVVRLDVYVENYRSPLPCSGTLVSEKHILTARHCVAPDQEGNLVVRVVVKFYDKQNRHIPNLDRTIRTITLMPGAKIDDPDILDGRDLAILRMNKPVKIVTPYKLFDGTPKGIEATMVGYGLSGIGSTGVSVIFSGEDERFQTADDYNRIIFREDGKRRAAKNIIDHYGKAPLQGDELDDQTGNIFSTDFDTEKEGADLNLYNSLAFLGSSEESIEDEGTTAEGDSGGPLLVYGNLIVGVLSGGLELDLNYRSKIRMSAYGDISWWTGVAKYRKFIEKRFPEIKFVEAH